LDNTAIFKTIQTSNFRKLSLSSKIKRERQRLVYFVGWALFRREMRHRQSNASTMILFCFIFYILYLFTNIFEKDDGVMWRQLLPMPARLHDKSSSVYLSTV